MPTIDELAPATAASDTDELPVFQSGVSRKVTRAQLLAGLQEEMAVVPGTLLGRTSAGMGAPETISIGSNLTLASGTLSAPAPFSTAQLPAGQPPGNTDLVAMNQSGTDAAVAYGPFMSGLSALSGIDMSAHVVRPTTASVLRTLADSLSDVLAIEAFGAVGDGVTDCTNAFNKALGSSHPILLGPGTYLVRGQCTVTGAAELIGVPGSTTVRRPAGSVQNGGAWISVQGPSFAARGIIFDANHHPTESWAVLVTAACTRTLFVDCAFNNATGSSLGCGLVILPNVNPTRHAVLRCEAQGNALHGIWVRSTANTRIAGCSTHDNAGYGICIDDNDPTFRTQVRNVLATDNTCWNNSRGISVGNFNQTNTEPPVWGNGNPDVVGATVTGNTCYNNSAYGIALSGQAIMAANNLLTGNGAGILFNASQSCLEHNVVVALPGTFGIDAGGCIDCDIVSNSVSSGSVGINGGGSQRVRISSNRLDNNVWGFTIYDVETDGHGNNFGLTTSALTLRGNRITFGGTSGGGIYLLDGPQSVAVTDNEFFGTGNADISQCLWANTDSALVRGNTWNNEVRRIVNPSAAGGVQQILVPDILDEIMVTSAPGGVQSIATSHALGTAGTVAFIRVANGGAGYTTANVSISGTGTGAAATAYLRNGVVIGVTVTSPGTGYGTNTSVTITGDGLGATAAARVGLAPLENRCLRIHCNAATRFDRAAGSPALDNWTSASLTVPAGSSVDWAVTWGSWRATGFALGEFLAPPGDGSLVLRTLPGGDLVLRPAGSGAIRFGSDANAGGCTLSVGHGSPDGVITAPPGSDYRNLDGGTGSTLWIKRTGTDAHGWAAIA